MTKPLSRYGYCGVVALIGLLAGAAQATELVKVLDPWARATVPGQTVGGVYMEIVARERLRLIGVKSAAAESAAVHQSAQLKKFRSAMSSQSSSSLR